MEQEFLDNLDSGWGDAISDTYEDATDEEFMIQISGEDYEQYNQHDIKIKTDIDALQLQAQFNVSISQIPISNSAQDDIIINNNLIIIFPEDKTTTYYNGELVENLFYGMYIKFEPSRSLNKNHCQAYIHFVHQNNLGKDDISLFYIPYIKKHSCEMKVSTAFKNKVLSEYKNNPYYDSLTKFDPADYKDKFDKHIYTVDYLLNH